MSIETTLRAATWSTALVLLLSSSAHSGTAGDDRGDRGPSPVPVVLALSDALSGSGEKIVFSRCPSGSVNVGTCAIFVVDVEDGFEQQLTGDSDNSSPAWSPDGLSIVFASGYATESEIVVMDEDGSNIRQLTFDRMRSVYPQFSPDGSTIAFIRRVDNNNDVYAIAATGAGPPSRLTYFDSPFESVTTMSGLDLSPDGSRIVVEHDYQLYVVNADGTNRRVVAGSRDNAAWSPAWSPDGTRIAFHDEQGCVMVVSPDGDSTPERVSCFSERVRHVGWSPDGTRIAVSAGGQILAVDFPGGERHIITQVASDTIIREFDWSDRRSYSQFSPSESAFFGTIDDGHGHKLIGVKAELLNQQGSVVSSTYSDAKGAYSLPFSASGTYRVRVALRDRQSRRRIVDYGHGTMKNVMAITPPVSSLFATSPLNVSFAGKYVEAVETTRDRLDDLAEIFHHATEGHAFFESLESERDIQPLHVILAFDSRYQPPEAGGYSPSTETLPVSQINLSVDASRHYDNPDSALWRTTVIWHEYAHHVMNQVLPGDTLANGSPAPHGGTPPRVYTLGISPPWVCKNSIPLSQLNVDCNHWGYDNASTQDSWSEGWAAFWPMVLNKRLGGLGPHHFYRLTDGTPVNLETNYRAWDRVRFEGDDPNLWLMPREELAVASLLWDLVDGVNASDREPAVHRDAKGDAVQISPESLWRTLAPGAFGVGGPVNPMDDMKDVYDALAEAVGSSSLFNLDGSAVPMRDIDTLFVNHGFFSDVRLPRHSWTSGEEIGRAADMSRPGRRFTPFVENAFLAVANADGSRYDGTVKVRIRQSGGMGDFAYEARPTGDGRLYLEPPPSDVEATLSLTLSERWNDRPSVTMSNRDYWSAVAAAQLGSAVALSVPPSGAPAVVPVAKSRLVNLSTRAPTLTGDHVMIGGFIVDGGPVTVAVRAIGPDLGQRGVPGALENPVLQLYGGPTMIAENDDWAQAPNADAIAAQGMAPGDPRDSVVLATLEKGAYTAIVRGLGGGTGIALVEVFQVSGAGSLVNLSTRGPVYGGDNVMIGGFILQGKPARVVVRAIGPDLGARGVPGALADPMLEIYQGTTKIAENDDWRLGEQATRISRATMAPGHDYDAAVMLDLQPGAYTAIVRGANGSTGIGLVEVFRVAEDADPYPGPGE